jgi:hypothetical protein
VGDFLGKAVINGEMRYGSVSAVKSFDSGTRGGCPRRWWFSKIGGKSEAAREAPRAAKDKGIKLDTELKHYLRTGEKNLSGLALKGLHILEKPGADLGLDVKMHTVDKYDEQQPDGSWKFGLIRVNSLLTAAGIPFVGELDVVHTRGHYRDDDGTFYDDPPDTVEVGDIKFKSYAKDRHGNSTLSLPTDLIRDIQMAGYGEWVARVRPSTKNVRLSHLYFPEKGALPTKVTRLHVIDDCRQTWNYVEGVVGNMKLAARETDVEQVPYNTAACDAFAGCPHREYCSGYRRTSLDNLYGKIANDFVQGEPPVGLLSNNPQMMQNAPQPAQQPQTDMRTQLAAEEAQMRAQVAQQQQQMPQQLNTAQLADACQRLSSFGFGFPALGANAAQAYAVMGGQQIPQGFQYQGIPAPAGSRRSLHTIVLNEVAHVYQLLQELEAERSTQGPQIRPGVVDASRQYVQAQPGQQHVQPVQYNQTTQQYVDARTGTPLTQAAPVNTMVAGGILPPGAPESRPELAMQQPAAALVIDVVAKQEALEQATTETKKKPGRPKKTVLDTAPEAAGSPQPAQTAATPPPSAPTTPVQAVATQVTPAAASSLPEAPTFAEESCCVLVNARFAGRSTKSLAPYVDYINAELSKRYSVTSDGKPGIQDVRCVPKDSPLAFGGWKGAVREVVKADPPPPDAYHLDTFSDDLNEVVADALRVVAEQRGWLYVRAVRG